MDDESFLHNDLNALEETLYKGGGENQSAQSVEGFSDENESEEITYQSYEECLLAISAEDFSYGADDPRSIHYKRVIIRPKISLIKTLLNIVIPLAAIALLCLFLRWLEIKPSIVWTVGICVLLCCFFIRLKSVIIWFIRLYQALAPEHIRQRCRFEPSCSHYVIQALEKYGLLKGLKKGINRMRRCREPNGGYDPLD